MPSEPSEEEPAPEPMGGREVIRMLAPNFLVSAVACIAGFILLITGYRTAGFVLVVAGAGVGSILRLRLMMRRTRR